MSSIFKKKDKSLRKSVKCTSCVVRLPNGRDIEVTNKNPEGDFNGDDLFRLLCSHLALRDNKKFFAILVKELNVSNVSDESIGAPQIRFLQPHENISALQKDRQQFLLSVVVVPRQGEQINSNFVLELLIFHFAALRAPVIPSESNHMSHILSNLAIVRQYLLESSTGIPIDCKRTTDAIMKTVEGKREFINNILAMEEYAFCWYTILFDNKKVKAILGLNQDSLLMKEESTHAVLHTIPWSTVSDIEMKKHSIVIHSRASDQMQQCHVNTVPESQCESLGHHLRLLMERLAPCQHSADSCDLDSLTQKNDMTHTVERRSSQSIYSRFVRLVSRKSSKSEVSNPISSQET